jgi:hypothetical protein
MELCVIPGAGHCPHDECPELVNAELLAFSNNKNDNSVARMHSLPTDWEDADWLECDEYTGSTSPLLSGGISGKAFHSLKGRQCLSKSDLQVVTNAQQR